MQYTRHGQKHGALSIVGNRMLEYDAAKPLSNKSSSEQHHTTVELMTYGLTACMLGSAIACVALCCQSTVCLSHFTVQRWLIILVEAWSLQPLVHLLPALGLCWITGRNVVSWRARLAHCPCTAAEGHDQTWSVLAS